MGGGLPAAVDGRSRRAEEARVNMAPIVPPAKRKGRPEGRPFAVLLTSRTLGPKVDFYQAELTQPPFGLGLPVGMTHVLFTSPPVVFSTENVSPEPGDSVVTL